jgi:hypothetical protein
LWREDYLYSRRDDLRRHVGDQRNIVARLLDLGAES